MPIYDGKLPHIFISYSHQDAERIQPVLDLFEKEKIRFWYDYGIEKGAKWIHEIGSHVSAADMILLFISEHYINSYWCGIEIEYALDLQKPLLPCYLDKSRSADWDWCLKSFQAIFAENRIGRQLADPFEKLSSLASYRSTPVQPALTEFPGMWGPKRPLFSMDNLPDYAVFNSVYDNPDWGDEKYGSVIADLSAENPVFSREAKIVPGNMYEVRLYYHNNADPVLNRSGTGMSNGVRLVSKLPGQILPGQETDLISILSSANGNPKQIWSKLKLSGASDAPIRLCFRKGTAVIHNKGQTNGQVLSESLFSDAGVCLGMNKLIGNLPGGIDYAGYVSYRFLAVQSRCRVEMSVSGNDGIFTKERKVRIGEVLSFRVHFSNTGQTDLKKVTFRLKTATCLRLVPDSVLLTNSANPHGVRMENVPDINGFQTGLYGPGADAVLTFSALAAEKPETDCSDDPAVFSVRIFADCLACEDPERYIEEWDQTVFTVE